MFAGLPWDIVKAHIWHISHHLWSWVRWSFLLLHLFNGCFFQANLGLLVPHLVSLLHLVWNRTSEE